MPGFRAREDGGNLLLAALPRRERERLAPHLQPVELAFDQLLYEPGGPIRHVYFPTDGIISLLLLLDDGAVAEVGRVGYEGMAGLPVFFGVPTSQTQAFVQIPGRALRMKAAIFRQEARPGNSLSNVLLRYAHALMGHTERLAACHAGHSIEERLCRWLLVTHDRVQADVFEVTQEFLARMFAAHRQSVTVAASNLQKAGLIRYSRGKLTILDRKGLEAASCECYRAIQRQFDELLMQIGVN